MRYLKIILFLLLTFAWFDIEVGAILFAADKNQSTTIKEIDRDDHFIAYNDGTVKDTKYRLMWASKDNGDLIDWRNATAFLTKS